MKFISVDLPDFVVKELNRVGEINRKRSAIYEEVLESTCRKFTCTPTDISESLTFRRYAEKKLTKSGVFTKLEIALMFQP